MAVGVVADPQIPQLDLVVNAGGCVVPRYCVGVVSKLAGQLVGCVLNFVGDLGADKLHAVNVVVIARPVQCLVGAAAVAVKVQAVDPAGCADQGAVLLIVGFVVPGTAFWGCFKVRVCFSQRYIAVGGLSFQSGVDYSCHDNMQYFVSV